jgi:hypothetical protein
VIGALGEVRAIVTGSAASLLISFVSLAAVVVGVVVDPVAAAFVTAALLMCVAALFVFVLRQRAVFGGPYEILDETIIWDLIAPDGSLAYLEKRQEVRFNYLAFAQLERAMGSGDDCDLFHTFECDYGDEIERLQRSKGEEALLILMKPERIRNEEAVLWSRRGMTNLFMGAEEWISFGFQAASKCSEFQVRFPPRVAVRDVRIEGPSGAGSRPAEAGELVKEQNRTVLRLAKRSYEERDEVNVTWAWDR